MKKFLFAAAAFGLVALPVFGQAGAGYEHVTKTDGVIEGGWVVAIPSGSSDFFNVRFDGAGRLVNGLSISVSDFGAATSFPVVGIYGANTGLDASGNTPDLSSPIATATNPAILGGPLFDYQFVQLSKATTPATYHAVVQFPPGDSGLLGVGGDSDTARNAGGECGGPNPIDSSGFTQDGYSTPAIASGFADFGLNPTLDPDNVAAQPKLRVTRNNSDQTGDFLNTVVRAGNDFGLALFTNDTFWLLFISFLGIPIQPVGPVLPTIAGPKPGWRFIRVGGTWPSGAGNLTINFVAITGSPGVPGSIQTSNEVTVCSLPDPMVSFGSYDDGSYESGWVVSFPAGSSDYFNVNFGDAGGQSVSSMQLAVMDFGTSATAYPRAGVTRENLGVDASGNTPDLGSPYVDQPATFPAFTFVTTSGALLTYGFSAFTPVTPNTHQFVQFPPGDPGLLGIGGDTNSAFISGLSGWSLDGYSTPANLVGYANWGMRLQ